MVPKGCSTIPERRRLKVGLGARPLANHLLSSRPKIIAMASAAIAVTVGSLLDFRCVIVFKRLAVCLDLPVQVCDLFGEPPARENARLAGVAMEQGAVDRNKASANKAEFSCQQHETTVHRLQGLPVLLAQADLDAPSFRDCRTSPSAPSNAALAIGTSWFAASTRFAANGA